MASNTHKSAAELEREVEMQRGRLSDTIDEIQTRLSPGQIVDQLMSYGKGGAGDFAQNLGRSVKDNPLPVALLGVSLLWLMSGRSAGMHVSGVGGGQTHAAPAANRHPPYYDAAGTAAARAGEAASGAGHNMASQVRGAAHDIGVKAGDALHGAAHGLDAAGHRLEDGIAEARHRAEAGIADARDAVGNGWNHAREGLSGASGRVSDVAEDVRHRASALQGDAARFLAEQPLIAGALAFAGGAALAALLPRTAQEDEIMGRTADDVKAGLKKAAEPLLQEGKAALDDVVEEGKSVLHDVVEDGKEAATEAGDRLNRSYKDMKETATAAADRTIAAAEDQAEDAVNATTGSIEADGRSGRFNP